MRLFPPIHRTTLDTFHRDVYRPRLALLVLILLLILGQQQQYHQNQHYQRALINSKTGKWKVLDGAKVDSKLQTILNRLPDRIRLDKSIVAVNWSKKKKGEDNQQTIQSGIAYKKDASPSTLRSALIGGGGGRRSLGKRKKEESYKSILKKVLNADALSALISLHILWAIRLFSMIIEDGLGKDSGKMNGESKALIWIGFSTCLALFSSVFSWSNFVHRIGLAQPAEFGKPTLSIQLIIFFELSATLMAFLPALFRLNHSQFPKKVSLPSPSHSPSLIDLLPIPTGLANAFKAPREDVMMYRRRTMANQWNSNPLGRHHQHTFPTIRRTGDLTGANATVTDGRTTGIRLAEPLRLPSSSLSSNERNGKAPRLQGMKVNVNTTWLLENVVILFGHLIGALEYFVIILSLPTLAPTSFPSLLAFLSLRSELGTVVVTWFSARKSVECLEFVQRRWSGRKSDSTSSSSSSVCAMCFEIVDKMDDPEDCCTLDCGHQLHSVCLVQWLTKQAFCPCCHSTLKATPPSIATAATTEVVSS